jgi:predicted nucleotidyltransferase
MGTLSDLERAAQVLFGSTRREVLALLFGHPDQGFHLREIQRVVGGGSGAVQRELRHLVAAGLVERVAHGHRVFFSANRGAAIFSELQSIVEKTGGDGAVPLAKAVRRLRRPILAAAAANGASDVRLFGSVARGGETGGSDVDFLVSLAPGRTLLDIARLEVRLEDLLHRPVDVVTEAGLPEGVRATVLKEAVPV